MIIQYFEDQIVHRSKKRIIRINVAGCSTDSSTLLSVSALTELSLWTSLQPTCWFFNEFCACSTCKFGLLNVMTETTSWVACVCLDSTPTIHRNNETSPFHLAHRPICSLASKWVSYFRNKRSRLNKYEQLHSVDKHMDARLLSAYRTRHFF